MKIQAVLTYKGTWMGEKHGDFKKHCYKIVTGFKESKTVIWKFTFSGSSVFF